MAKHGQESSRYGLRCHEKKILREDQVPPTIPNTAELVHELDCYEIQ